MDLEQKEVVQVPKFEKEPDTNKDLLAIKKNLNKRGYRTHVRKKNSQAASTPKSRRNSNIKKIGSAVVKNKVNGSLIKIDIYEKEYNYESVSISGAIKTLKIGTQEDLKNYKKLIKKYQN